MTDVLFLITARSGSKGVVNKNIRELFGIPLLAIRGLSALKLTDKENVWLSTDSEEYVQIGKKFGINVPFVRPEHLASDKASSADVVLHAMEHAERIGRKYKMIALLEPTSPFVYFEDIENAILKLKANNEAVAIVATKEVEAASVFVQKNALYLNVLADNLKKSQTMRRQDFETEITPAGGFYIAKWDDFLKHKTFYTQKTLSYILPEECSLEIDNEMQFKWAEFLVEKNAIIKEKIV